MHRVFLCIPNPLWYAQNRRLFFFYLPPTQHCTYVFLFRCVRSIHQVQESLWPPHIEDQSCMDPFGDAPLIVRYPERMASLTLRSDFFLLLPPSVRYIYIYIYTDGFLPSGYCSVPSDTAAIFLIWPHCTQSNQKYEFDPLTLDWCVWLYIRLLWEHEARNFPQFGPLFMPIIFRGKLSWHTSNVWF